ncbi:hypothetical protein [Virgibacillus proomii]|nr:hypothetical protein [Virgibacillus proomii]
MVITKGEITVQFLSPDASKLISATNYPCERNITPIRISYIFMVS